MINLGTVRPVNVPLTTEEQAAWRTKPHRFISEAAKTSASMSSSRAYLQLLVAGRCWWCGVIEGEHE